MDCRDAVQLLGICGSLRNASYNRALLRASNDLAPAGVHLTMFDLAAVPPTTATSKRGAIPLACQSSSARSSSLMDS